MFIQKKTPQWFWAYDFARQTTDSSIKDWSYILYKVSSLVNYQISITVITCFFHWLFWSAKGKVVLSCIPYFVFFYWLYLTNVSRKTIALLIWKQKLTGLNNAGYLSKISPFSIFILYWRNLGQNCTILTREFWLL